MAPRLISASRRTDIPRYYARWFAQRRAEGFAEYRNVFGSVGRVSLHDDDVLGYVFWTRDPTAFDDNLAALDAAGIPWAMQYTITDYDRELEPHVPSLRQALGGFLAARERLPGSAAIQWRYDPIVLSDRDTPARHITAFETIARALRGATSIVNVSIVEPYRKTVRRVRDTTTRFRQVDPKRHTAVAREHPTLPEAGEQADALLDELDAIAAAHDMALRVCSNPEIERAPSQCCGAELFADHDDEVRERFAPLQAAPSRTGCRCISTVDIGMDNTCIAGCRYCYVVTSQASALVNFRRHDPAATMLRSPRTL